MNDTITRKLIGKITLEGTLICLTGLHIGASKENLEIGAVDSPVVRDPVSEEPYVPGSSLKGKLRTLLEKANIDLVANRKGGSGIMRHECEGWSRGEGFPGALACPVCRLFGSTALGRNAKNFPARLKVRDLPMTGESVELLEAMDTGLLYTELKFENGIDRVTSAANPRNIERVPRGANFVVSMVYDVEDVDTLEEDLANLKFAVTLLQDDALGGHGSRGYGQVKLDFETIEARKMDFYRGNGGQKKAVKSMDEIEQLAEFFSA